ncbi:MAG TPA: serine/threonine-protein kinase, partial [Kofleriaceae bacterium]|nr:serine/threonine-protein kinase [Kofleriaceae bacterium]
MGISPQDQVATVPLSAESDGAAPRDGDRVGRFVVHHRIGSGAMGVVVAAYDPVLDRWVALKLLHATDPAADAALIQEAQAMARLAHPNVVAVHDAGTADGRVYLAMEFVDGGTLRAWRDAAPRTWREVRDRHVEAGRGLAAAHDAGLVHRDFKPDNVLVGGDGRARVTDFGLVRAAPAAHGDAPAHATTVAGTPRYMAPEQHRGERADARADQFAFCVALFEALWQRDPFEAGDAAARKARVLAGEVTAPPPGEVPARVAAAVLRGLDPDPARRHPSMRALLDEIARDPDLERRRRWRLIGVGLAGAALAAAIVVAAMPRGGVDCAAAADALAPVWPARRPFVEIALARVPRPYAATTAGHAAGALDAWARAWRSARISACRATHERGIQSEAVLDARMRCLDHRLAAMATLVEVLATADAATLDGAIAAIEGLPSGASCGEVEALAEQVPPPSDPFARQATEAVARDVARAAALATAGRYREGLSVIDAAHARAATLGHAPTLAAAAYTLADVHALLGEPRVAEPVLREAIRAGAAGHTDDLVARSWLQLAFLWSTRLGRAAEALALRDTVEAAIARAGGGDWLEGRWSHVLA